MAEVGFPDLVELYRHTRFDDRGGAVLKIANDRVADIVRRIEGDEVLYDLTQISLIEPHDPAVGAEVAINVAAPSHKLGVLARDFDALFLAPGAAFEEPARYFVVEERYARGDKPEPETLTRYRALLEVVGILRSAATYVGELQRELVFIGDEKVEIPILFSTADLTASLEQQAVRLSRLFDDPLHESEKTELLASAVIELAAGQRRASRFSNLIVNLDRLCDDIEKGYKLFVSSFSYSRIRKEIETARLDYIGKIHKTLVDIQGQLLGIPIATIVVASQLKQAGQCDTIFWTNSAVILGAWIFVCLLWLAIKNQWYTLGALDNEIDGQRDRLKTDYAALSGDFGDFFGDLKQRVRWHRTVLVLVMIVAIVAALLATVAYFMLTPRGSAPCLLLR